jgi:hypothetical protein
MDDVAAAWERWLRSMHWAYWATGTFARPLSPGTAVRVVSRWLAPLGPRAYAAVGIQHGPWAAKLHVHVLVGGVRRVPLTATLLRGSWLKGGHVQVDGYRPAKGAVEYLVRQADDIELLGDPRPFDPRWRRPRICDRSVSPGTCLSAPTTGCPAPPRMRVPPPTSPPPLPPQPTSAQGGPQGAWSPTPPGFGDVGERGREGIPNPSRNGIPA